MRIREFFEHSGVRAASDVGSTAARLTLDKESLKTPHFRMNKSLEMIEDNPSVFSGLTQLARFVVSQISFKSQDDFTMEYYNQWLQLRPGIDEEIFQFVFLGLGCGNSYLEPLYTKDGKLDNLFHVPDPSIIYYNLQARHDDEYWLMQMPSNIVNFKGMVVNQYPVYYMRGDAFWPNRIWAIPFNKKKYLAKKFTWGRDGLYGIGLLGSAVDNEDIRREIIKNWALIAKYQALGKKMISILDDSGKSVGPNEIEKIATDFSMLGEEEHLFINRKMEQNEINFSGNNMMNSELDFLRKDAGSALVPNYMTAFSQDSSYATAEAAKVPFSVMLKAVQKNVKLFIEQEVVPKIKGNNAKLKEDVEVDLGQPELYSRRDLFDMMSQLYNMRAATFNELREAAGLTSVERGDTWGEQPPLDNTTVSVDKTDDNTETEKLKESLKPQTKFIEKVNIERNKKGSYIEYEKEEEKDKDKNMKEAAKVIFK